MTQSINILGFAWYSRDDYQQLRTLFSDRDNFPQSYDEWLKGAETGIEHYREQGVTAFKVEISPSEISGYCRARGLNVDSNARKRFVN